MEKDRALPHDRLRPLPDVDIVLSVYNGARYVVEQVRSLQKQTHPGWHLWVRDDGSTDASRDILSGLAREDDRIRLHPADGRNLGAAACYGYLLERLPADARYVFMCDADDVWLPPKIERTLELLLEVEGDDAGPVLVHTDLAVVDEELRPLASSFWELAGIDTEATSLRHLRVANVATGPTLAMNRALADLVVPIPASSPHHDWWITLAASAFGVVAALPEPTVLYRRHASNVTGISRGRGLVATLRGIPGAAARWTEVRRWVDVTARQAAVFLERYEDSLDADAIALLREVAEIPGCGPLERKRRILRAFSVPGRGWLQTVGLVLRV